MHRQAPAVTLAAILFSFRPAPHQQAKPVEETHKALELPYHASPPHVPLSATLDAVQFDGDHSAFVAYRLAAKTKPILYQVPCYCGCGTQHDHKSLLDCFTGTHGVKCHACQKEVIFCFTESKKGKSAMEIRQGLAAGEAWKLNLSQEVERLYPELRAHAEHAQ